MNPEKPNFLDRGTILAIVIVVVFWMGWQKFMDTQYPPQANQPAAATPTDATTPSSNSSAVNTAPGASAAAQPQVPAAQVTEEKILDYSDQNWSMKITSKGMGLEEINIKNYQTRTGSPVLLADAPNAPVFSTQLVGSSQPLNFKIEQTGPNSFVGHASAGTVQIEKTVTLDSNRNTIDTQVHVSHADGTFKGLTTSLVDNLSETTKSGFLSPQAEFQSWYVSSEGKHERKAIHQKDGIDLKLDNVSLASLSAHYFTLAVVDSSPLRPRFESSIPAQAKVAGGSLVYQPISPVESFDVRYTAYAGPKLYHHLAEVNESLPAVIDYGTFSILARPILQLLRHIFDYVGNWGWAIVILTVIVRLVVLPINIYSYKSMKAMQRLQPEMARVREKYKNAEGEKKLQMNQEIMQLMRDNNASPLGGCLPMLLQLPVFWALYQVLGQSIELYRAPFIFWIQDLSARDPYFVLPILMGVVMFIQQKITPTTMDPQQAKIMMWVPLIFSFFMVSLPSGLTLYIFVSTLFAIVQQFVFMRDRTRIQAASVAKA